jgi:hypothetical protein
MILLGLYLVAERLARAISTSFNQRLCAKCGVLAADSPQPSLPLQKMGAKWGLQDHFDLKPRFLCAAMDWNPEPADSRRLIRGLYRRL